MARAAPVVLFVPHCWRVAVVNFHRWVCQILCVSGCDDSGRMDYAHQALGVANAVRFVGVSDRVAQLSLRT
jgi:hypothetical protein